MGSAQSASDAYTGFVVVRLRPERFGGLMPRIDDLRTLAKEAKAAGLSQLLNTYSQSATNRLVTGVRPAQILEYEQRWSQPGAEATPSLTSYWRIDARAVDDQARLVELLRKLPEVDIAYQQPRGSDPVVDSSNDQFAAKQSYLKAAPTGINAEWAWTQPRGDGSLIAFVDVERGWIFDHEDLPIMKSFPDVSQEVVAGSLSHGTAVVGIAAGLDNTRGIVGIAPKARWVSVSSHIRNGVPDQVADAIATVTSHMESGDVLLIEWQTFPTSQPAEVVPDIWTAIRNATNAGIVVVEAAGNGNASLDGIPGIDKSNRATDSGAIMAGAAHEALDSAGKGHNRFDINPSFGSNFGARLDCYAVGENLVTAGPAKNRMTSDDLTPGAPDNHAYRKDFGATSGSAPIVAGAAVLLQSMHVAVKNAPLTPRQMRTALSTFGTPQGVDKPGHIGVMPNLREAATQLGLAGSSPSGPTNLRVIDE